MKRFLGFLLLGGLALLALGAVAFWFWLPLEAERVFGAPTHGLTSLQEVRLSYVLVTHESDLLKPAGPTAQTRLFQVKAGESANEVAHRLQAEGFVPNAEAFSAYLVYKGLDRHIRQGTFKLSAARPPVEIASALQFPLLKDAVLVILPGWRREEIAASLASTGLSITAQEFLRVTSHAADFDLPFAVPKGTTLEGFLFPDSYEIPREATAKTVAEILVARASKALSADWQKAVLRQGLTPYQGLVLASIVQRETEDPTEMPLIASVYYNRLRRGMALEADPTVQYALGKPTDWWPAPLNPNLLYYNSLYNTYIHKGLPPAPIDNPGADALKAVAYPAQTDYLYFRAACGSPPHHLFSRTYQEHLQKGCP